MDVGVVILAAGASTRMGRPKQLLSYQGKSLIRMAIEKADASMAGSTIVVVGARHELLQKETEATAAQVAFNTNWKEGMATSIICGIQALLEISPAAGGVILMVCDLPFVTTSLLNDLVNVHQESGKPIVASSYANTLGTPVFFHKIMFPQLLQLTGEAGAKKVITQYADQVESVLFPEGSIDVDTQSDYDRLTERINSL